MATEKQVWQMTDAEKRTYWANAARIFKPTGEPLGETPWRRWRTESGWHPSTPQAIIDEHGWLFDFTPPERPRLTDG